MTCTSTKRATAFRTVAGVNSVAGEVWRIDALSTSHVEEASSLMPAEGAFRIPLGRSRKSFLAARLIARSATRTLLGDISSSIRIEQNCPTCGAGGHGRPSATVADSRVVFLSWSHSREHVAAVAGYAPVGIDVESFRGQEESASERISACVRLSDWTRREALLKCGAIAPADFETADPSSRAHARNLVTKLGPDGSSVYSLATAGPIHNM